MDRTNVLRTSTFLMLLALAGRAERGRAADIYVNPGSSITNALASASPGDTVHLNAGTYNENVQIHNSGTSNAWISLVANGAVVINAGGAGKALRIAANYIVVNGLECTNYLEGVNLRTGHIKILNCNFHSGTSTSSVVAGSNGLTVNFDTALDDIDIENSNFYFNDGAGADFGCNNTTDSLTHLTLANCQFYSNNAANSETGAVGIGHQGTKANISVIHCQAYDNLCSGFDMDAPLYMDGCIAHDNDKLGGPNWGVGIKVWGHTGNPPVYGQVTLVNCLAYNNTEETTGGGGINIGGTNSLVANCLVSGNNAYAGFIICSGASLTIKNTILYGEHYAVSTDSDVSGLNFDASNILYNCAHTGPIPAGAVAAAKAFDPQFVNPVDNDAAPWGDFHLRSTSPAIDAGVAISGLSDDADGNPRPSGSGFDIGPYEYQQATVAKPVITSALSASGTVGSAFSYTITASNSPNGFGAAALPSGLGVNSGTGVISGTPNLAGTYSITLSASNSGGTGTAMLTLTINAAQVPPVITSTPAYSPNPATAGQSVAFATAASDANGDPLTYTWNFGEGGSGTGAAPSYLYAAAGSYTATVSVSDGHNAPVSASVTVTVNAVVAPPPPPPPPARPVITSAVLASGVAGTAFSYTISASNSPTTFSASGLPAGLALNANSGIISGTPTVCGTFTVTLGAANAAGTGTATLTVALAPAPGTIACHVAAVTITLSSTRLGKAASASVKVVDAKGKVVKSGVVSGSWSGLTNANVSGVTNTSGVIKFTSARVKTSALSSYTFTVTNITKTGYTYAPGQNAMTSVSINTQGVRAAATK